MEFIRPLLVNTMCTAFPLCVYLIYVAYIRSIDKKESKLYISITILISLLLLIILNDINNPTTSVFLLTPLILSYLFKRDILSIIISTILVVIYTKFYNANFLITVLFYTTYFLIYRLYLKKDISYIKCLVTFFLVKILFSVTIPIFGIKMDAITKQCLWFAAASFITFIIVNIFTGVFLKKTKDIMDINITMKKLDKEKKLRAAIFKLSHEIKNPLAVCNGYLSMMDVEDVQKTIRYIDIIENEIKRSLTIINDFSNLGKIKTLDIEELDITLLLEDTLDILKPLFQEKNIKVNLPIEEFYIKGDYNRLKQVFINIFKNSYESKKDIPLVIDVKVKEIPNYYEIQVIDNGIGIKEENLKKIYKDFFTTKETGTGLGIPYIKEIIELHKGHLSYESKEGLGTTVIIDLPIINYNSNCC